MPRIEPFEKYTAEYENWFEENHLVSSSELEALREQLPKSEEGVEIGVGTGRFAAPLGIQVGVEPSGGICKIAARRFVQVAVGIGEDLPFGDAQFDKALLLTTLCLLDNVKTAFAEIYRILRVGGHFVIGLIDEHSSIGRLHQQHKETSAFNKIAAFYSTKELVRLRSG